MFSVSAFIFTFVSADAGPHHRQQNGAPGIRKHSFSSGIRKTDLLLHRMLKYMDQVSSACPVSVLLLIPAVRPFACMKEVRLPGNVFAKLPFFRPVNSCNHRNILLACNHPPSVLLPQSLRDCNPEPKLRLFLRNGSRSIPADPSDSSKMFSQNTPFCGITGDGIRRISDILR